MQNIYNLKLLQNYITVNAIYSILEVGLVYLQIKNVRMVLYSFKSIYVLY